MNIPLLHTHAHTHIKHTPTLWLGALSLTIFS